MSKMHVNQSRVALDLEKIQRREKKSILPGLLIVHTFYGYLLLLLNNYSGL